ncbi:hypothetical protein SRIMM317S_03796 [Streptomyces rimosus subsp. rimosus]
MIAKYFATSLAIEKVVRAPRVIRSCLPISTISMSLVGLESRSTMFPASLAAEVPVFMATPTSAWASAGASLVPSPVMATSLPPACSRLISAILSSGVASARKSSTPASSAMALAVSGLSPVIMTVLMPILRNSTKRSRMPSLTTSLRWMTPRTRAPRSSSRATSSGVPPASEMPLASRSASSGTVPPLSRTQAMTEPVAPLRTRRTVPCSVTSTPDMRVWAVKGTHVASTSSPWWRSRSPYFSLARTTMERPSGVSSASEDSWAASATSASVTPLTGTNSAAWRLPRVMVPVLSSSSVETSPAASTARPDIARTLRWTSRSMPAMPMADSSAPIVVGIRQTSSASSTIMGCSAPA